MNEVAAKTVKLKIINIILPADDCIVVQLKILRDWGRNFIE